MRDAFRHAIACGTLLAAGILAAFAAFAQTTGIEPLATREIAAGIFVYQAPHALAHPGNDGAVANLGFIVGRDAVAVIDTGGSLRAGQRLLAAIRMRTALPIRYVVNTHMHPDHMLGNAAFADEGARIVGHHKLARALEARSAGYLEAARRELGETGFSGTAIALPDMPVSDAIVLDLGERRIKIEAHATAHTDNDLTVFDSRTGTWFLGDLLFVGHVPVLDGRLRGWLSFMSRAGMRRVERVVPGHGPAAAEWPAALDAQERYLKSLERSTLELIRAGRSIGEAANSVAPSEREAWELFNDFNARNAITAYKELEWE